MHTRNRNASLEWPIGLKIQERGKITKIEPDKEGTGPCLGKDIKELKWYYSSGTMQTKQSKKNNTILFQPISNIKIIFIVFENK